MAITDTESLSAVDSTDCDQVGIERKTGTIIVLDTSALVSDPEVIFAYPEAQVVIPLTVVEELDGLKKRPDETGRSARQAIRSIWTLIEAIPGEGDITKPVRLPNGGTVRVEVNGHHYNFVEEHKLDIAVPDNRILNTALSLRRGGCVKLVSNDVSFRVKAVVVGLDAEEQRRDSGSIRTECCGYFDAVVDDSIVDAVHHAVHHDSKARRTVPWTAVGGRSDSVIPGISNALNNEYVELISATSSSHKAIARVTEAGLRAAGSRNHTDSKDVAPSSTWLSTC